MKKLRVVLILCLSGLFWACDSGPQVIADDGSSTQNKSTGVLSDENDAEGVHTIVALEVLPTDQYVYVYAEEKGDKYWIAGLKSEVVVGESYRYSDGFLQTDFHSKEYDRVFDEVYLVSQIIPVNAAEGVNHTTSETNESNAIPTQNIVVEGSMRIVDLVENSQNLEGQQVQVSGVISKVNSGIMDRNWLHIKDGSNDAFDLVITSDQMAQEGSTVTMNALVTLNKDFGAGYKYELILENGQFVK
jgi:hypothetical protein